MENDACDAGQIVAPQAFASRRDQAVSKRAPWPSKRSLFHARLASFSRGRFRRAPIDREGGLIRSSTVVRTPSGPRTAERLPEPPGQFSCALDLLPLAVVVTNPNCEIVFANAAAEEVFGYSHEEFVGMPTKQIIPRAGIDLSEGAHPSLCPLFDGDALSEEHDLVARRKDGSEFPAEFTMNPISTDEEIYTLTIVIDRTEHYELLRNRHQLAHLTRVSTLGELAGSLAHELNQPLTAILSNVQAAQRFMATEPINLGEVREILRDLVDDNHRASEVIRKIRVLVKKERLEAAPLSIESVIRDVVLLVHSDAIVRGIRILVSAQPGLPAVHGDKVQLQQVILNLMLNAFDALESSMGIDRVVTIEATVRSSADLCIAVRDQGAGVTTETTAKLFMPFFTSKRDGLGLGLSISRSIVEMHGGRIWAENNATRGATFFFTLPTPVGVPRVERRVQT